MKPQTSEVIAVESSFPLSNKPPSSSSSSSHSLNNNNNNTTIEPIEQVTKTIYRGGAILQLRPNLSHLNVNINNDNDEEEEEIKSNKSTEFTTVKATFQKRESEWAQNKNKKIAAYNSLFKSDEPFIPLEHFHANVFILFYFYLFHFSFCIYFLIICLCDYFS